MICAFTPTEMGIYVNKNKKNIDVIKSEIGADIICNLNLFNWADWTGAAYTRADGKVVGTDGYGYYGFGFDSSDKIFTREWSSKDNHSNFFGCWDAIVNGLPVKTQTPSFTDGLRIRTVLGITKAGKIGIYCNSSYEYPDMMKANLLAANFNEAVVVDGGGSTQLRSPFGNVYSTDGRAVHTLFWAKINQTGSTSTKPNRNLFIGCRGEDVKLVQRKLKALGYNIDVDGIFGMQTLNAVLAFQRKNGLFPDGICGKNTYGKMFGE